MIRAIRPIFALFVRAVRDDIRAKLHQRLAESNGASTD
jgi:hypothetical protein